MEPRAGAPVPVWSNAGRRGLAFAARFSDLVCREAGKYDIVHVHVDADLVPLVRKRHPDKTIVLHHHGDRLRLEPRASLERRERHPYKVLVSAPDLREYGGHEWLPNPADTDLFAGRSVSRNGKGLYLLGGEPADAKNRALDDPRMEVEWVLHDSTRDTVRYADMPDMLSKYEYYSHPTKRVHYSSPAGLTTFTLQVKIGYFDRGHGIAYQGRRAKPAGHNRPLYARVPAEGRSPRGDGL